MPPFAVEVRRRVSESLALAKAANVTLTESHRYASLRSHWHVTRVEILYEIAYLRLFVQWELYLEAALVRYLCGYRTAAGVAASVTGAKLFSSIAAAEQALLAGKTYLLWHNPKGVVARARKYLLNSMYEQVLASNEARLMHFADLRHRITHGQKNARMKFDIATMAIAGRRYRGARPGRFLRDWDLTTTPPRRWLDVVGDEISLLAKQIG